MDFSSYMVIDTETTGLHSPFVLQMGFCDVKNWDIQDNYSIDIMLPEHLEITPIAFKTHGLTRESLRKTGIPREIAIPEIHETLRGLSNTILLGQSVMFDMNALNWTFRLGGLIPLDFESYRYLDSGIIFKAYRMMKEFGYGNKAKRNGRPIRQYLKTIRSTPVKDLKWNIDFCLEYLNVPVPPREAHNAGEDCCLTHLIFKAMWDKGIVEEMVA